jgi:hypothetical protein
LSRGLAYEHEGAIRFKMQREPVLIPDLVVGEVRRELTDREHAAGTSDLISSPEAQPELSVEIFTPGGIPLPFLTLTVRRNLAADDTAMTAEFATDFDAWSSEPEDVKFLGEIIGTDGFPRLRWRAVHPFTESPTQFLRLRMTLTLP